MSKPNSIITAEGLIYAGVSYPDLYEGHTLSRVLIGFDNFLNEPHFYKELWGVDLDDFDKNIGYKACGRRDEGMETFIEKTGLRRLSKNNGLAYKKYEQWLMDLKSLRESCFQCSLLIAEGLCFSLEKNFSDIKRSIVAAEKNHVLRLVKYPDLKFNDLIEPHEDPGFITLQLHDSFSGFRFGKNFNIEFVSPENKVTAFLGKKAELFSEKLFAMPHAIVNNLPKERSIAMSFSLDIDL
ncbi:MAG: hypothetical protein NTY12_04700 [Candidatus Falkowbacteria bacterium]|nr:hypothetical protein [Candidatus Falkowbacteria bacterium]